MLATRNPGRTEADIQSKIAAILHHGGFDLGHQTVHLESPAADQCRLDIEVGALIVECKKNLGTRQAVVEGEKQLGGYLRAKARRGERYVGILTDGVLWQLYVLAGDEVQRVDTFTLDAAHVDEQRFRWWLGAVLATEKNVRPTNETINEHFGAQAPSYAIIRAQLQRCWDVAAGRSGVAVKRELWARLLRSALGSPFEDTDPLFLDHTYLVLLATLIGYAIADFNLGAYRDRLDALLSGQPFTQAGFLGVGQSGFFDWVLETPDGPDLVTDLIRRVQVFDWQTADHDVLKALYQSVISPEVRHRLGEYYTPDWLARRMVSEVITDPLHQRVLDPACGSGTFLFHSIRRYLAAAEQAGTPIGEALGGVTRHVLGMDLHPVAVVLAQTTYLLAIGLERLKKRTGPLSIPVYLGDSMQWDAAEKRYFPGGDVVLYAGEQPDPFKLELRFPAVVTVDMPAFEALLADMVAQATDRSPGTPRHPIDPLLARRGVPASVRSTLRDTYDALCDLHDAERDHIWGFYIRNQIRPMWLSQETNRVDVLIGNPPWLAYRSMPPAMQAAFKGWSTDRGLWASGKSVTGQDLSAFFAVRSMDLYLRAGGRFGWVMPHAVLSRSPYAAFRTGAYKVKAGSRPIQVAFDVPWDLEAVVPQPFPVPAGVIFGTIDGRASALPAETVDLVGHVSGADDSGLVVQSGFISSVAKSTGGSVYGSHFHQGATLVPRSLIMVTNAPPSPLGMPAGLRLVQSRRSSLDKAPWNTVVPHTESVEEAFIRPVYLGESIAPFRTLTPGEAVLPHDGRRVLGSDEIARHPGLAAWWRWADREWLAHRSSERLTLIGNLDYMHKMSAQFPVPQWRVVYTASGTTLAAAVVKDRRAVVEHKLYWAAAGSLNEALYLEAILNAPGLNAMVKPFQSRGAYGPRDFDKYVWIAPIPVFDPNDPAHQELVRLARRAERIAQSVPVAPGQHFQSVRRAVRAALEQQGLLDALDGALAAILPPV